VIVSDATATLLSTPHWGFNQAIHDSLIAQSHAQAWGLGVHAFGTAFQIFGVAWPLISGRV
jgi:hypothetical protein